MIIDIFFNILEKIAKYSWAMLVVSAFVIFISEKQAKNISLYDIRSKYEGYWWLVFVFCLSLQIAHLSKILWQKVQQKKERTRIISRLNSLSEDEQDWIACCLYKGKQTLVTWVSHHTANSLVNKGILIQGTGHPLGLPYHIRNDIWEYLNEHKSEYISKFIFDASKLEEVKNFEETLSP